MRILILTNKMPFPARDGGSIATLSLAQALYDTGNNIQILSMNTSKHFIDTSIIPKKVLSELNIESVSVDTSISTKAMLKNLIFNDIPYNAERFIDSNFSEKLIKILKTNSFDIVQLEGLYLCPYIDVIKQHSDAKISLRAHNIEHEIWERTVYNEKSHIKRKYLNNLANRIRKFEYGFIDKYDLLVPITERDALKYQKMGNTKPIQVIPTGVDSSNYKPEENNSWPGLFHIGALDWIPNQEGLLWFLNKVWPIILEKHPDAEFNLAGRNAPDSFLSKIQQKGINYLGEVECANDFINANSIMIVPLLSGSGMRIKIIEGMALGKVIVTTSIGTEGIPTTHNENILISDTAEVFAHEVNKLITNRELFDNIRKNAIKFVNEHFNNKSIADKLANFYESHLE